MSKKAIIIITVIVLILLGIGCFCFGIFYLISQSSSDLQSQNSNMVESVLISGGEEKIAVIDVKGVILDTDQSSNFLGESYAPASLIVEQLENARTDDNVKGIILNIDSPGGGVYPSELIYQKIVEVQNEGKPVVALMRSLAASGGYYVAAPADKIIASELTITGSIGVVIQAQNLEGLYEKLGIETVTITNTGGEFKTDEGLYDGDPDGELEQIYQTLVDESYDHFIEIIVEGRGMSTEEVKILADGRIYTGRQAMEQGLVDELGEFEEALATAKDLTGVSNPTVIQYEQLDFFSLFSGVLGNFVDPASQLAKQLDVKPGLQLEYRMPY